MPKTLAPELGPDQQPDILNMLEFIAPPLQETDLRLGSLAGTDLQPFQPHMPSVEQPFGEGILSELPTAERSKPHIATPAKEISRSGPPERPTDVNMSDPD